MLKSIMDVVRGVLTDRRDTVWLAVRQRAKFEGWLKLELARALETAGFTEVMLECRYAGRRKADLAFRIQGVRCFMELSMCNTNWRVKSVRTASRPITKNVEHVLKDIEKLKMVEEPDVGLALTLFFPVPINWSAQDLLRKIGDIKGGKKLLQEPHILDVVEVSDGVGVAFFLFGPYQSGRAISEQLLSILRKYGVRSVSELAEKIRKGDIEEHPAYEDYLEALALSDIIGPLESEKRTCPYLRGGRPHGRGSEHFEEAT